MPMSREVLMPVNLCKFMYMNVSNLWLKIFINNSIVF